MQNKRRLILALLAGLCLCVLLALPSFADAPELTQQEILDAILAITEQDDNDSPIDYLLSTVGYTGEYPYFYQFQSLDVGDYLQGKPIEFPFTSPTFTMCAFKELQNGQLHFVGQGSMYTTWSISDYILTYNFVYFYRAGNQSIEAFRLTLTADSETYEVLSTNFRSDLYGINGNGTNYEFAFISKSHDSAMYHLFNVYGFAYFTVDIDYNTFNTAYRRAFEVGYNFGYFDAGGADYQEGYEDGLADGTSLGYNQGYDAGSIAGYNTGYYVGYEEGETAGNLEGLDAGYALGFDDGYDDGLNAGYTQGYTTGYNEGLLNNDGYQEGYNDAVSQIEDGEFGRNLLGNAFSAPFEALNRLVLIDWTTQAGQRVTITVMTVFYTIIGISLFIWFLKLFSGG